MKPRIYIDTSMIGGCLDPEFARESNVLLQMAKEGKIRLLVSDLLIRELDGGPESVRAVLRGLPSDATESVFLSQESQILFSAYMNARIIAARYENDAVHVAIATVSKADLILSWNFKHLVHWDKIRMFNSVNMREGYPQIEIRSPWEYV